MRWRIDISRSTGAKARPVAVIELSGGELERLVRVLHNDQLGLADEIELDLSAAQLALVKAERERR